ncbi:MAG: hypothetical protein CVU95_08360 [Firmicutes bacterium HGW-Firmicutes-2]|jgi:hypothetical protein|nr:MAG: hypothetical protein CVU95_08360 [Firmicutes bacterium HGW-Firmicutes-2]
MNNKIIIAIRQNQEQNRELMDMLSKIKITHEHKWTPINDGTRDVQCKNCGVKAMRGALHFNNTIVTDND